jgi:acyl-CoA reductase-like NAD-dependent aldehyde dehydrogenase
MSEVRLFIGGRWREGSRGASAVIVNPATEASVGRVILAGCGEDADLECEAARRSALGAKVPQRARRLAGRRGGTAGKPQMSPSMTLDNSRR